MPNDFFPDSPFPQGKWSRDLVFSLIARDSRRAAILLATMVLLAASAALGVASAPGVMAFVVIAACAILARYALLKAYREGIPDAAQGVCIERGFKLLSTLIGLSFGSWAAMLIHGAPQWLATVIMAATTANLMAVPFLAPCLPAYFGMTLPMMLTCLAALWWYPQPQTASLSVMFVLGYGVATRMVFVHRHAVLAKLAEEHRREAMDRQHQAMMANESVAIAISEGLELCSANARFMQLLGPVDGAGQGAAGMLQLAGGFGLSARHLERVLGKTSSRARRKGVVKIGLSYHVSGRTALWLKLEARLADPGSAAGRLLWLVTDNTANKKAREELTFLAQHDALTGLANRYQFAKRARQALVLARARLEARTLPEGNALRDQTVVAPVPSGVRMAVLCIDLDGFKAVNDRFGHSIGDEVLVVIARRLSHAVRSCDVVARFGGDEFTVLLQHVEDRRDVALVVEKLMDLIGSPIEINDLNIRVGASIGMALGPEDGAQVEALLIHADRQMYAAKQSLRLAMERQGSDLSR